MTSTSRAVKHKISTLEDSSRRLASTDFSTPRFYTSLLLEDQIVPARNAKPFEQNLFMANGGEAIRNIKTREGADEFETAMELMTSLNEICQNKEVQRQQEQIRNAHEDVLASITQLTTKISKIEDSLSSTETQQGPGPQEGDEIMTDVVREEGEIFALEQMLSEKRHLLNHMQKELDDFSRLSDAELRDYDKNIVEDDPELVAETAARRLEIENMDRRIQEQRQQEEERIAMFEEMSREIDELTSRQQEAETTPEEKSSPIFEELARLWQKASEQDGDSVVQTEGIKEAYLKLERLLDNLERCQRHIVILDVFQQIASTLIDSCADPAAEFDPPRTDRVILAARTLQVLIEAGGTASLPDLKDRISKEAVERGASENLGVQAVYGLVASYLIQIDRSKTPNLVTFT